MAPTPRIGILPSGDRQAIFNAARQLRLPPHEFGALLSLESGPNMDPNIRGGANNNYYGMIQFGPGEQQKYLDPFRMGKYTREEQMPKVVQYFLDRGFKPGQMGIDRAYATVLGGNPNASLTQKDSFGTSVAGAVSSFKPGGGYYKNAQRVLGDIPDNTGVAMGAPQPGAVPTTTSVSPPPPVSSVLSSIFGDTLSPTEEKKSFAQSFVEQTLQGLLSSNRLMPAQANPLFR